MPLLWFLKYVYGIFNQHFRNDYLTIETNMQTFLKLVEQIEGNKVITEEIKKGKVANDR